MSARILALAVVCVALIAPEPAPARDWIEPPALVEEVAAGRLPPVQARVPEQPLVVDLASLGQEPGQYGGELRMLMSQPKDTRMMVVYSYARLIGYTPQLTLAADLLESVQIEGDRTFTLKLRRGHRWSDGHPFTSADFRFFWENIANDPQLSPGGPPAFLMVDGRPPSVSFPDETTVRYSWEAPNPFFLPALAGARPEYIYAPAHYLRAFHAAYVNKETLKATAAAEGARNWQALFTQKSQAYRDDNPDLPTLDPWIPKTKPPASRFVFARNPYFHRVDGNGRQLPYIDEVSMTMVAPGLIPAKAAAGDADLQGRSLSFENYTILKQSGARNGHQVLLWRSGRGSEMALFPNLTTNDPEWRALLRDVRFRRALSLAINRHEVNQVIYYGLAIEGADTVLPESPLFADSYARAWSGFDLDEANRLLDQIGLKGRSGDGVRRLPSGRRLQIVVETAGEDPAQVAILELIRDTWRLAGVDLFIKPEQRDLLRNRAFSGELVMAAWPGLENGLATPEMSPQELAPTTQQQLSWPKWGQHFETGGKSGEPVDYPPAQHLANLNRAWVRTLGASEHQRIWREMLQIRAEELFSIGTVRAVPQPIVVNARLRNVPKEGLFNWEPGAYFGLYHPDAFWFASADRAQR